MTWVPPEGLDPQVLRLCTAINALDGVATVESCCGHGARPFMIYLAVREPDCLLPLLYLIDYCHSGEHGWQLRVYTDCDGTQVKWELEGPAGGHAAADSIAAQLTESLLPGGLYQARAAARWP